MNFMKKISIVLMDYDNDGKTLDYQDIFRESSLVFGGYTITKQKGGYLSEDGKIMYDDSTKVDLCFYDSDYSVAMEDIVKKFLNRLFIEASQEMVFVELDNQVAIISENDTSDFLQEIKKGVLVKWD